ncbi:interaptin [Cryptosporidium bovis]|uniref:interaptin n=1 Tax=Cryptosporidium bovis TaxID=310047 RepID=UPI003519F974|nr:interaptin [Cryptosporidium bovis]
MQSIFKNAFDKVSVIKDAVGHSIEEAVKNNPRDSTYVLNTGTSITSSIANWAEKNHVSEKANIIKNSASVLVGDLASGLKGVTNNISLQNNFGEKFINNQDKKKQMTDECNYFQDDFSSFNNSISLESDYNNLFGSNTKKNLRDIHEDQFKQTGCTNDYSPTTNSKGTDNSLIDDSKSINNTAYQTFDGGEAENELKLHYMKQKPTTKVSNKKEIRNDCTEKLDFSNKDVGNKNIYTETLNSSFIKKVHVNNTLNNQSNIIDNISSNHVDYEDLMDLNSSQDTDSTLKNEAGENCRKFEATSGDNIVNNPLSVFQQIGNLEKENLLLKEEVLSMKAEILELNEKLASNEKTIDKLSHKNIELTNENKSLISNIEEINNEMKREKTCFDDLENMTKKATKFEKLSEEQKNTIQILEYKITKLENTIDMGEAEKIESTINFQREIMELRQQLLHTSENENKISLPYLNRIRTLEDQLNETRIIHSKEIQRFEVIIGNLRNQNVSERNDYEKLEKLLNEERSQFDSNIKKLEFQIKHYKDTIRSLEKKNAENDSKYLEIIPNKVVNLGICPKVIDIGISGDSTRNMLFFKEKSSEVEKSIDCNNPLSSRVNRRSILSYNPLQEELRQMITDKQLLEEDYIRICDEKKHAEDMLSEEKQRNKLLKQQLDNMLKLANDLTDKLDNTNEVVKLQKKELQQAHLRLK